MSQTDIRVVPGPANYWSHDGALQRLAELYTEQQLTHAVWVYGERALKAAQPFLPAAFQLPGRNACSARPIAARMKWLA